MPKKDEEVIKRAEWEIFERKGKVAVKKKQPKTPNNINIFQILKNLILHNTTLNL